MLAREPKPTVSMRNAHFCNTTDPAGIAFVLAGSMQVVDATTRVAMITV